MADLSISRSQLLLLAGTANRPLAEEMAHHLGQPLCAVTIRRFADGEQHNGAPRFVTRDHLGSVREMTDSGGALATRNDYDPYGRMTRVGGTADSRFAYTGHYVHGPTGLAFTLYRAYDPQLGRWLNEDPIGLAGGINLVVFAGNDPVNQSDPLGLWCVTHNYGMGAEVICSPTSEERANALTPQPYGFWDYFNRAADARRLRGPFGGGGGSGWAGSQEATGRAREGPPTSVKSCRAGQFSGMSGTISIQTNADGFVSWGIRLYNPDEEFGVWFVNVYVGGRRVDGKAKLYAPHGSVHPTDARPGRILSIEAVHLDPSMRLHRNVPNDCVIP